MNQHKNTLYRLLLLVLIFCSGNSFAQTSRQLYPDSVETSLSTVNYYLRHYEQWYPQNYEVAKQIRSLVHYLEDQKVDTVVVGLTNYMQTNSNVSTPFFFRTIENISDSLNAPGYISYQQALEEKAKIDREVRDAIQVDQIEVPESTINEGLLNVKLIPMEQSYKLLEEGNLLLPDSLIFSREYDIDDDEYQQILINRRIFAEKARQQINAERISLATDSIVAAYQEAYLKAASLSEQQKYDVKTQEHNRNALFAYNKAVEQEVNDTVQSSLRILLNHVNNEQLSFWLHNTTEDSTQVFLSKEQPTSTRIFIKNMQQDSLGVRVYGNSRNSVKLFIDDGVTLTRFKEREHREANFKRVDVDDDLDAIKKKYEIVTPWTYGAQFDMAFTQIYLENWVKGGETSLSVLMTLKAYANYSLDKLEWENSVDIRSGWLSSSDDGLQKSEDRFQFVSNLGLQAFNKWYYSAELDVETQLFNSYNYPDRDNPQSGFFAPVETFLKLGMDYKNVENLSLFVSPLTMKSVFVRDTAVYDQTQFGVAEDMKSFWDIGLNLDLTYTKQILESVAVTSKYQMFLDYQNVFTAFDIDWENTFDIKVNDYMKAQLILHILYDDNVTFDTGRVDAYGDAIYKAKWQFKEFVTIGFTYSLDREKRRRRKVN